MTADSITYYFSGVNRLLRARGYRRAKRWRVITVLFFRVQQLPHENSSPRWRPVVGPLRMLDLHPRDYVEYAQFTDGAGEADR